MLGKNKYIKELVIGTIKTGGRNHHGSITSFHRGGGHKRKYRLIDHKRSLKGIPAKVKSIEYDPFRNSLIALISYSNGILSYIIASDKLKVGDIIISNDNKIFTDLESFNICYNGSMFYLKDLRVGDIVSNIEIRPGSGGIFMRSAGTFGQIMKLDLLNNYVIIKMSSGEERLFSGNCQALFGKISNGDYNLKKLKKAGENRWRGKRSIVRGIAMNPVDHPHGGRTNGGRHCSTPWGRLTKGQKTRSIKKSNKMIIKKRK